LWLLEYHINKREHDNGMYGWIYGSLYIYINVNKTAALLQIHFHGVCVQLYVPLLMLCYGYWSSIYA